MLDSLRETGKNIGHEIGRAWDVVSDGWRELFNRSSNALTHFVHARDENPPAGSILAPYPRWSLLAGEVEETDKEIVVRLEVPGMEKKDCEVRIEGNRLFLSGRKHFERTSVDSNFHIMERAYGSFQRVIPLPKNVLEEKAEATYLNGVLTVRLPKMEPELSRSIPVS
ncbi:Hsp20/alpha crystallin family protein [Propionivibrio sp.]|uniref:Hsp20/alpha crystallin family protein n=1 Tax=Propionivibrio sp. TaxID=2212460 RepID=UPI003BF37C3C